MCLHSISASTLPCRGRGPGSIPGVGVWWSWVSAWFLRDKLETNLTTLEAIRARSNELDIDLTRKLSERARFPFHYDLYCDRSSHPEFERDGVLFGYIHSFYVPKVLGHLFPNSSQKLSNGGMKFLDLDIEIVRDLWGRTCEIGKAAAFYKHPRKLPVYDPKVENGKIAARIQQSIDENLGLAEINLRPLFKYVFEETRRIEELYRDDALNGSGVKTDFIISVKTDNKDIIPLCENEMVHEIARLGHGKLKIIDRGSSARGRYVVGVTD